MEFRSKLIATLRAIRPVLDVPGVLVVGSEVPNLVQPEAASTLVVSQDVDIAVPVESLAEVRDRLGSLSGLRRSNEEPSVWVPESPDLIEVNFVGMDRSIRDPSETYAIEDPDLPLLVFGPLGILVPAGRVPVEDLEVPVPSTASLLLEKLLTDRSAQKGARDLLVAAGLLSLLDHDGEQEFVRLYRTLPDEMRHDVRSNITVLSLMESLPGMPDPKPVRDRLAALLRLLECTEASSQ